MYESSAILVSKTIFPGNFLDTKVLDTFSSVYKAQEHNNPSSYEQDIVEIPNWPETKPI